MKYLKTFEKFNNINETNGVDDLMILGQEAFDKLPQDKKNKVLAEVQQIADNLNCDVQDLQDPEFVRSELEPLLNGLKLEESFGSKILSGLGSVLRILGLVGGVLTGLYNLAQSLRHLSAIDDGITGLHSRNKDLLTKGGLYFLYAAIAVGAASLVHITASKMVDKAEEWESDY